MILRKALVCLCLQLLSHVYALPSQQVFDVPFVRQVIRINLQTESARREAANLLELHDFDVWRASNTSVDLMLRNLHDQSVLQDLLPEASVEVLHQDIDQHVQAMNHFKASSNDDLLATMLDLYHPLSSIEALLQLLSSDHPEYTRLFQISTSAEGRPIYALKVSDFRPQKQPSSASKSSKQEFLIVAGAHAREWIAPASSLYSIQTLLQAITQPEPEPVIAKLLKRFEFTFVPTYNPDGYVHSFESDRLWRKTRQSVGSGCYGIDLNKNWGYHWSKPYRSNPCTESYSGDKAFEAVEIQHIRDYISNSTKMIAYLDMHAFGQLLMTPYAYSCNEIPHDAENLYEATLGAAKAARSIAGKVYQTGAVCDISYGSAGDSVDWVYGEAKIRWSFSVELRDLGLHGFLLPPDQIRPTGAEALAFIVQLATFIQDWEDRQG